MSALVVPLARDLVLLPLFDAPDSGQVADWSSRGPVALVDAEHFGGTGSQRTQVRDQGRSVLKPLVREEDDPVPDVSPISQSLWWLGGVTGEHHDEFEAVGLGRHRDTADWVTSAG
ncbi:hypothetical protein [Lentzea flaviverrucosa]|uniref:Uncharacterized protein n=1 Tax=Lentzea flaviverrucosa TaxID=200379 RepID=A0A1H9RSE9_9PSEU|nr:hypothetical protein [Lentzea flaviverrucosa]RDI33124.1 hypothetical protein DFR72_102373 [Lentzea flaviverrucosa]SER75636.1 hypothetical protein SAMN05216195_106375 [Lentzea flaviverrucosa]